MTSVFDLLINTGKKYSDRIALKDEAGSVTYSELLKSSYSIAGSIQNLIGNSKSNLIFIVTSKAAKSLVAVWGVIASGNYYACIDDKASSERVKYMIEKMNPSLIIDASEEGKFASPCEGVKIVNLDECLGGKPAEMLPTLITTDPLYMVFTSGSTGYPKAIIKNHQSILAFADSFVSEFKLSDSVNEVFGNQASYDYDVSAKDIFISVYLGATLCIIPNKYFIAPAKLAGYITDNEVSILIWAASAIKFIEKFNCFGKTVPKSIKHVFFSGEPMTVKCMEYWGKKLPDTEFYNLYAPSEVTGNCLYYKYSGNETSSHLPLDKTFPNAEVLFLTEAGKQAVEGEKGEAYVRGEFLAQGYYHDSEQTREKFVQNPLHDLYPDVVYRTGDYFLLEGGKFLFSGRVDNQIKHMGHRIELEEIEASILKCLNNPEFCILYDREKENIILLSADKGLEFKSLLIELRSFLPKYMLPYRAVIADSIPMNARGKVDRSAAYALYKELTKDE